MDIPLQIVFRGVPASLAVKTSIRERVERLARFSGRIQSCLVIVQEPNGRHLQGNLFKAIIDLTLPGVHLAVGHGNHGDSHSNENVYVALRDAFDAIQRQVQSYMHQRRREVKTHVQAPHAHVSRLFPQDGYGFLTTTDGREIYFHVNSVLNGAWQQINVGTEVRFSESLGENGPQATTVDVVKLHAPI